MSVAEVIVGGIAALGGLGGLAALWKVKVDRRAGVSADLRQARRDEVADQRDARRDTITAQHGFIDRLERRVEALEDRLNEMEAAYEDEREWNSLLLAHIWEGRPPPPPPRPIRKV